MSLLLSGGKYETKPKIFRKENIFLSSALKGSLNSQEKIRRRNEILFFLHPKMRETYPAGQVNILV